MASPLADTFVDQQERLRLLVSRLVGATWEGLPAYRDENVDEWLSRVLPLVAAGQQRSVALTDAYLALQLGRGPLGVDPKDVSGAAARAGTPPEEVYKRPFVTVWAALGAGTNFDAAASAGLERATLTAETDVQLSMRDTLRHVGARDGQIWGYRRVANGSACTFCKRVDGAQFRKANPMPLHPRCGCGVEPVPYTRGGSTDPLPEGVAVRDHGELGPLLGDPAHDFTRL